MLGILVAGGKNGRRKKERPWRPTNHPGKLNKTGSLKDLSSETKAGLEMACQP